MGLWLLIQRVGDVGPTAHLCYGYGAVGLPGIGGGWALDVLMLLEGKPGGRGRRRAMFGRVANRSMVLG